MGHDLIDKRSLELNRLVVEKIRQQSELMDFVREKLNRSLEESRLSEPCKNPLRECMRVAVGRTTWPWREMPSTRAFNQLL